ncbi:MAG: haloacid dehalogenase [Paenibacillus sp.]|jgi:putative hydrolase of the HAD superfamily|nr:haloacid dehalogenase [Paenibacillus sp.]
MYTGRRIGVNKQTILFDLDDTLIHCNKYFDIVVEQFADLMTTWFSAYRLSPDEIKQRQYEFDYAGVNQFGFAGMHFPHSLVKTYEHYSALTGRTTADEERDRLVDIGNSVYTFSEIEPYPHMSETLDRLQAQGHDLFLYTGGEASIQRNKVKRMGLDAYFGDRLFIFSHKTTDVLETILSEQRFNRDTTWMIGNSIRTDVVPALQTGINAIYIPAITEWQYNVVDIDVKPKRGFLRLDKLADVPPAIFQFQYSFFSS